MISRRIGPRAIPASPPARRPAKSGPTTNGRRSRPRPLIRSSTAGSRPRPQNAGSDTAWWSVYNDPVLDGLMRQIDISNQNLIASEAAYRQALAITAQARSNLFPTITANAGAQRLGQGGMSGTGEISLGGEPQLGDRPLGPDPAQHRKRVGQRAGLRVPSSPGYGSRPRRSSQPIISHCESPTICKTCSTPQWWAFARSLQITQNRYDAGHGGQDRCRLPPRTQLESTRAAGDRCRG